MRGGGWEGALCPRSLGKIETLELFPHFSKSHTVPHRAQPPIPAPPTPSLVKLQVLRRASTNIGSPLSTPHTTHTLADLQWTPHNLAAQESAMAQPFTVPLLTLPSRVSLATN